MKYFVYILKCNDGTLYTGYTTDIKRRTTEHNISSVGAKYTKGRRPVSLVYSEELPSKGMAMSREVEIKKLSKSGKLELINGR